MNKPTKKQLVDAVTHYQTALDALIEGPALAADELFEAVKKVRASQPSLEPAVNTVEAPVEVTATTVAVEQVH